MRLHDYVIDAARRTPDALALSGPDGTLTYRELDELAARQGDALRAAGVRPGSRVVIWTGKSIHAVALMQAVLRCGAMYAPVTAANPPVRMLRIASDCAATLVVADDELAARAAGVQPPPGCRATPVVTFAALLEAGAAGDGTARHGTATAYPSEPDDGAYLLYTSGSTGTPKGVRLSHRNAMAFVDWAADLVELGPGDRLSNHAPFNFDLSVFDLYAAFKAGASVHLVSPEMAYAPDQLVQFIRAQPISVWYSVPSVLTLMMRDGGLLDGAPPPALRVCVFAGEPMPLRQVQALRKAWPGVRLFNWYGPTETNVCTSYEVIDADLARTRPLPIGLPACDDLVELDPPGEEGEIVVSGPTVMLGYWGREPQQGPYRTGDIGRRCPDGLEYVGRLDDLVKVRGHRIELGEIEAALGTHPSVADVAVVVVGHGLEARLHAVVVPAAGEPAPSLLAMKRFCAQHLPTYMIIDVVHQVATLPLTPNGKTNRPALVAAIEGSEL